MTGRCEHNRTCLLCGDHWVHVDTLSECDRPPITDGPLPLITEAP